MDILTTVTLLSIVRQTPAFQTFFLDMFFPTEALSQTKEIAFDKLVENLKMAPFVSPLVAGRADTSQGGTLMTFAPPYVKPMNVVEPGKLLLRQPGEAIGGDLTPQERRLAVITGDLMEQEKRIKRREEWMAAQIICTGKVICHVDGKGEVELDFGRRPENNITLSGAARWSALDKATSRQPLDDIESWCDLTTQVSDVVIMGKDAWSEFRQFECVKELLETRRGSDSVAELAPSTEKVVSWRARLGTIDIFVHKGVVEETDGTEEYLVPPNGVLVGPRGYQGVRGYGAIQDAKANANGIVAAARYPKNWFTDEPSAEYTMTQAAPMPITPDPDAFAFALV